MKIIKKSGIVMLIMVLVLGCIPALSARAEGESRAMLSVKASDSKTISYKYGETKKLGLTVKNTGNVDLRNVRIVPRVNESLDVWPFEVENRDYAQVIESLTVGQETEVVFEFTARENVQDKYYKLPMDYTADVIDGEGNIISCMEGEYGVYVKTIARQEEKKQEENKKQEKPTEDTGSSVSDYPIDAGGVANVEPISAGGAETGSVPRVIVTGFTTDPANVKAGANFKLTIHLKNTSKSTAVSNLLFDLSSPTEGADENTAAPAFLPASGSSSIYLEKIAAGGTQDISIELNAKADLVQKPYSVELSMKYEDMAGGQFESASAISIPVKQDARFEFGEFEISPDTIAVGEEANIMCELYNLGRVKLYNVKAIFEGTGIKKEEVFVGNVDSGATASIDGMVTAEKATNGPVKMKMTLSYEDESGKVTTTEKEFQLEIVESAPEMDGDMGEMTAAETNAKLPIVPIVAVLLIIAAVAAGIVFYKKKKKRKLEEEEEGLIDEFDRLTEDEPRES